MEETCFDAGRYRDMGTVTILQETTRNPLTLMGERAGICWGSDIGDPEKNRKRGRECLQMNHGRVLEYVNIELVLDGYSARVIREWYTHIGGGPTRLQASTRYINYNQFDFVVPHSISKNEKALECYRSCMEEIQKCASYLTEECKIPKEDVAMMLPLGMETKVVDKRNLRNFLDMCKQRLCTRAYWEYRELMREILSELRKISPEWEEIVDNYCKSKCDFLKYCPEKKSCGRYPVK